MPALALATKVRLGFAVVTTLYAALTGLLALALPWILLVVVLDLVATGIGALPVELPIPRSVVVWVLVAACALSAGLAFNTVGPTAAPLAFIPAYHAGLLHGRLGFLVASLMCAVSSLLAVIAGGGSLAPGIHAGDFALWMLAILTLGLLGAWSLRIRGGEPPGESAEAREARALLQRLHELASEHGTELDAPATASLLLERLAEPISYERALVLGREPHGALQPLAFRGVRRVSPEMMTDGRFVDELLKGEARIASWHDELGDRTVLVGPLGTPSGQTHGVVALDRSASEPFTEADRMAVAAVTRTAGPDLEVALLFSSLRTVAAVEERQRLAHEMHDGIAQDLAALGFGIDAARTLARRDAGEVAPSLDQLRENLGDIITGLRSRISDLAMTQRPERSLGAVLSSAVQAFGSATGIATTITVREDQARLPAHVEAALFKIVMDVLDHARTSGAERATVSADLSARSATVDVEHDGSASLDVGRLRRHGTAVRHLSIRRQRTASGATMVRTEYSMIDDAPRPAAPDATGTTPSASAGRESR